VRILAVFCAVAIAAVSDVSAQTRFRVLGVDTIDSVNAVRVYTIRDDKVAACYILFVLEPLDAGSAAPSDAQTPVLTPDQLNKVRVAQTLRDVTAVRDRRLVELKKRVAMVWTVVYQNERERIEEEYEGAVRVELPELYPAAQVAPGWRTTGTEMLNEAVRRAIADGDASLAAAARSALDDQLLRLLNRANPSASLTVSGPVPCGAVAK
jgi:hypothetical protein